MRKFLLFYLFIIVCFNLNSTVNAENFFKKPGKELKKAEDELEILKQITFGQAQAEPQKEEARKRFYNNEVTEKKEIEQHLSDLRTGKIEVKTFKDVILKFNPSTNDNYIVSPPVEGPIDKNQFFFWNGTLKFKKGDLYFVRDAGTMLNGKDIVKYGFSFKNIKKKFKDLQLNMNVIVIGRYIENTQIILVSGKTITIPVLTECYVDDIVTLAEILGK